MRASAAPAAALMLSLAVATPLRAQAVSGQLVERGGGVPVGGAFVVLINEDGVEVARALTGESGTFLLRAPAPGTYRLRSKRIGFRLWESPPMALADSETRHFRLEVDAVPLRLPAVVVAGRPQCGTRGEAGTVVAQHWEEAREALAAVQWTLGQRAHWYTLERFERERTGVAGPLEERRSTWSGYFGRPFGSIAAEDLARRGYVAAATGDSVDFYGPDAEVLLGDVFLSTHCFSARQGRPEHPGLVGLAFEPAPGRSLPDVEGVLWIAVDGLELRFLEFRYTQLRLPPDLPRGAVGGYVEFLRLPTGPWVVKHWWIRTPRLGRYTYPWPNIVGYRETGGQVLTITTGAGAVVYSVGESLIEGYVVDSTRGGAPLPRATVRLTGTDRAVSADDRGQFQLSTSLEGAYRVWFTHPRLDSLGVLAETTSVNLVRGSRATVTLSVPPEPVLVGRLCPDGLRQGERVIIGVVRDSTGGAVPDAEIHVQLSGKVPEAPGRADHGGRFVICGAPATRLVVWATAGPARGPEVVLEFSEAGVWVDQKQFRNLPSRIWAQNLEVGRSRP